MTETNFPKWSGKSLIKFALQNYQTNYAKYKLKGKVDDIYLHPYDMDKHILKRLSFFSNMGFKPMTTFSKPKLSALKFDGDEIPIQILARESIPELYTPKSLDDYFNEYEQELKGSEYYNRKQLSQDDLTDAISHAYSLYDSFLQDYFDIVSEDDCERYKKDIQATYNLFRSSAPKKANRILTGEGDNGILGILLDVHKNIKDGSYTSQSNIRSHIEEITNQRKRPEQPRKYKRIMQILLRQIFLLMRSGTG